MDRTTLGRNGLDVSAWCLGTMTFGNQTAEADAFAQMDRALAAGVTFWDCAEMYPVNPVRRETIGGSEAILGRWLASRGGRDRVQIATKITGPSQMANDNTPYDGAMLRQRLDASLRRLQTDHVDLYQLHWPVRGSYAFRQDWGYDPSGQDKVATLAHMDDVLGALADAVTAGKIRAIGLSNESAWGLTRWTDRAEAAGAPRIASVQNEYSLLYRLADTDLAEALVNEGAALLAYSPLAAGLLTGKYAGGAEPAGSRAAVDRATGGQGNLGGRRTARGLDAAAAHGALAARHGWDPVQLAIAWTRTRPYPVIPIIGATSDDQLRHLLDGAGRVPDADLIRAIDRLHRDHPRPY